MSRLHVACTAALALALVAPLAAAQDDPPALPASAPPPAHLAFVEGAVDLVHEGVVERADADVMLVDGDVVRTLNGRAEIVFADGSVLHLDHDTELELLSPLRLRLANGRVLLRVSAAAAEPFVIDTQAATTRLTARGEYDLTADRRYERLELSVARGSAEIDDGGASTLVRGGETASILGQGGRVLLQAFNTARLDAFERWSSDRVSGFSTAASARHLPSELRAYSGQFDSYGRWDHVSPYGNVWFPAVGAGWRPFYTGEWRLTRYGWTWIGHDPWAWPTHHYGRWGFTGLSWYWIPHRSWGPAWVSWVFVPGYVSWSPLGWDNRAAIRWYGRPGDHPAYWPSYEPYRAWTVVPRHAFGGRRSVRTHAIDPARLPEDTRRAIANVAVPRGTVSSGAASGMVIPNNDVAVPRTVAPGTSGVPRRDADSDDARRRGGVRSPDRVPPSMRQPDAVSAPGISAPRVDTPRSDPSRARPAGARRDPARAERPQSREGSEGAERPPTADRPQQGARPRGERPPSAAAPRSGARPPSGERTRSGDSGSSGRARPSGVAVPRGQGRPAQAAPPPRSGQSSGQSGGARRRPPQ
jgi:hypothetical protein